MHNLCMRGVPSKNVICDVCEYIFPRKECVKGKSKFDSGGTQYSTHICLGCASQKDES